MSADRGKGGGPGGQGGPAAREDAGGDERLSTAVYLELKALAGRAIAGRESPSLHATALVHEAWLRLSGSGKADYRSESHFKAVAALAMKQVLADHARARSREKRGGGWERVTLSGLPLDDGAADRAVDAEDLQEALARFAGLDPRAARIVELRFLGGLSEPAIASVLGVSERTVRNDWAMARAWLRAALSSSGAPPGQF